ncbi:MAG: sensor domain-containing diguanylate cyclase [Spirochaetales bacterium]|nr:sensor domain-containing diguanylate cyclase [Spirochaetales bacterium]
MNNAKLMETILSVMACFKSNTFPLNAIKEALRIIRRVYQIEVINFYMYNNASKTYDTLVVVTRFGVKEARLYLTNTALKSFNKLLESKKEYAFRSPKVLNIPLKTDKLYFGMMELSLISPGDQEYFKKMEKRYEIELPDDSSICAEFNEDVIKFHILTGRTLATGINNLGKAYEHGSNARDIDIYSSIITEMIGSFDRDKILKQVLINTVRLLAIDRARLYLVDNQKNRITGKFAYDILNHITSIEDKSFSLEACDVDTDNILQAELEKIFSRKSFFYGLVRIIPLKIKEKNIGFFVVDNFISSQPLKNPDLHFLNIMLKQASVAIENAQLYSEIENLAIHDTLTGLYNARFFFEKLQGELKKAARYKSIFSVLMMDIDHFKSFNDNYGHQTGDRILKAIGKIIKSIIRETDVAARYGGDEFIVLLVNAGTSETETTAERIRKCVEKNHVTVKNRNLNITVSVGGITYNGQKTNTKDILEQVDKCLYQAKNSGRNTTVSKKMT